MNKDKIIKEIIDIEWPMFAGVNNAGGKASCQMDPETFRIMRTSQYLAWSEELLNAYLQNLKDAKDNGRNLMSEKYGRMMEKTFPEEYKQIAHRLPQVDPEVKRLVNEIVHTHIDWKEELDKKYPFLADRGRPLHSSEETLYGTPSLETYMRSELQNLSLPTISLYHAETMRRKAEGRSEAEENLANQVRQYGFENLEAANKFFKENS